MSPSPTLKFQGPTSVCGETLMYNWLPSLTNTHTKRLFYCQNTNILVASCCLSLCSLTSLVFQDQCLNCIYVTPVLFCSFSCAEHIWGTILHLKTSVWTFFNLCWIEHSQTTLCCRQLHFLMSPAVIFHCTSYKVLSFLHFSVSLITSTCRTKTQPLAQIVFPAFKTMQRHKPHNIPCDLQGINRLIQTKVYGVFGHKSTRDHYIPYFLWFQRVFLAVYSTYRVSLATFLSSHNTSRLFGIKNGSAGIKSLWFQRFKNLDWLSESWFLRWTKPFHLPSLPTWGVGWGGRKQTHLISIFSSILMIWF